MSSRRIVTAAASAGASDDEWDLVSDASAGDVTLAVAAGLANLTHDAPLPYTVTEPSDADDAAPAPGHSIGVGTMATETSSVASMARASVSDAATAARASVSDAATAARPSAGDAATQSSGSGSGSNTACEWYEERLSQLAQRLEAMSRQWRQEREESAAAMARLRQENQQLHSHVIALGARIDSAVMHSARFAAVEARAGETAHRVVSLEADFRRVTRAQEQQAGLQQQLQRQQDVLRASQDRHERQLIVQQTQLQHTLSGAAVAGGKAHAAAAPASNGAAAPVAATAISVKAAEASPIMHEISTRKTRPLIQEVETVMKTAHGIETSWSSGMLHCTSPSARTHITLEGNARVPPASPHAEVVDACTPSRHAPLPRDQVTVPAASASPQTGAPRMAKAPGAPAGGSMSPVLKLPAWAAAMSLAQQQMMRPVFTTPRMDAMAKLGLSSLDQSMRSAVAPLPPAASPVVTETSPVSVTDAVASRDALPQSLGLPTSVSPILRHVRGQAEQVAHHTRIPLRMHQRPESVLLPISMSLSPPSDL